MLKQIKIYALLLFISASCNNNPAASTNEIDSLADKKTVRLSSESCYRAVLQKDTVTLHLNVNAGEVTGELAYKFFEKDSNKGSIRGEMNGDTLMAEYIFMSEGVQSAREVAFLQRGDQLIEGYGPMEEKTGRSIFTDHKAISFDEKNIVLRKIDCAGK